MFHDRRLTLKERRECAVQPSDLAFLAAALSVLKIEGEDVTPDWVEANLTEADLGMAVAFVLAGTAGVEKHAKALADAG